MNLKYFLSEVLAVLQGLQEGLSAYHNQLGMVLSAWHCSDPYIRPAAAGTLPAQPLRPQGHQPGPRALPFTKNPLWAADSAVSPLVASFLLMETQKWGCVTAHEGPPWEGADGALCWRQPCCMQGAGVQTPLP